MALIYWRGISSVSSTRSSNLVSVAYSSAKFLGKWPFLASPRSAAVVNPRQARWCVARLVGRRLYETWPFVACAEAVFAAVESVQGITDRVPRYTCARWMSEVGQRHCRCIWLVGTAAAAAAASQRRRIRFAAEWACIPSDGGSGRASWFC